MLNTGSRAISDTYAGIELMTTSEAISSRYDWLRKCGYSHDAAIKELNRAFPASKPSERTEEQSELFEVSNDSET